MRLIDADAIYPWYINSFSKKTVGKEKEIKPNEIRFSMNDIRENLDNIPTYFLKNKEEWIYRPIPDFENFFKQIEEALGFKLFIWQKTFIITGHFRQYGETTAKCIKRLTIDNIPIDLTQRPRTARERFEAQELSKIYGKLQTAGVPTCPVFLTKKDKENYYAKLPPTTQERLMTESEDKE